MCPRGPGGAHRAGTSPWSSVRLQYNAPGTGSSRLASGGRAPVLAAATLIRAACVCAVLAERTVQAVRHVALTRCENTLYYITDHGRAPLDESAPAPCDRSDG